MADLSQGTPSNKSGTQPVPNKKPAQPGKSSDAENLNVHDPDAIQGGMISFWHLVEHNSTLVVGLILAIVVGTAGYGIRNWWIDRNEKKAQDAYYAVEAKYMKLKEGFDRAKMKDLMPAEKDEKTAAAPATGDLAKDYGSIPTDFEKVARDNPSTSAGAQAAIIASDLYLSHGQPDKAVEIAQVPAKTLGSKTLLGSLVTVAWGNALAAKDDCAEAVKIWKQVLDSSAAAFLHADAGLRSGLCYEALNQPDKAREMYQKVTAEGADSMAGATAKSLLRALNAKSPIMSSPAPTAPAKG